MLACIVTHSLTAAAAARLLPPADNNDKGVGSTTMIALAIGVLLPIAINHRCLPPLPWESTPPLATITFSWLLPDCCCHRCLLSTAALLLPPSFPPPSWSMRRWNAPFTTNAAFAFTQLYPHLVDCWSVVVCCLLSTQLPSTLSRHPPTAPSSSIIAQLPLMVGCCLLLVILHPLCCPLLVSLLAASSLTILIAHPKHPLVCITTIQKDKGMIGDGNNDNNVTHVTGEDEWRNSRPGPASAAHPLLVVVAGWHSLNHVPRSIVHRISLPPQRLPHHPRCRHRPRYLHHQDQNREQGKAGVGGHQTCPDSPDWGGGWPGGTDVDATTWHPHHPHCHHRWEGGSGCTASPDKVASSRIMLPPDDDDGDLPLPTHICIRV